MIDDRTDKAGVYKITNKVNGKYYYGGTGESFKARWSAHITHLNAGTHRNKHLQSAWNKYGPEAFEFDVIQVVEQKQLSVDEFSDILDAAEQYYLDLYWDNCKNCYNICPTANSNRGRIFSEEARQNMSKGQLGRQMTTETRQKMSQAQSGEKHPNYGKHRPIETRDKLSAIFCGENSSTAKLNWNLVREIRQCYITGEYTQGALAAMYDVSRSAIHTIVNNSSWIDETYSVEIIQVSGREYNKVWLDNRDRSYKDANVLRGENHPRAKLTLALAGEIRAKYNTGRYTIRSLATEYSIGTSTIHRVINNKIWVRQ